MADENVEAPLLSICLAGRDDDYMVDFRYRACTTINHYARSITKLHRKVGVEVVFTDWGSDVPLSQGLTLSSEAASITRFIFVTKEKIRQTQEVADQFHTTRSLNTSISHSKGKFLFLTNADQLMPQTALQNLVDLLYGEMSMESDPAETLMVIPRIQVPWQFLQRQPTLKEWDRYLYFNEYALLHEIASPDSYVFGSTGGFVVSRQLANRLGALNEKQSGWGWSDIDFCFRTTQEHDFVFLSNVGIQVFHMGHAPFGRRSIMSPSLELDWSDQVEANDGQWGLSGPGVEEQHSSGRRFVNINTAESVEARSKAGLFDPSIKDVVKGLTSKDTVVHAYKAIASVSGQEWKTDDRRVGALSMLAWYGLNYYPRRYLELGIMQADGYGVIASTCPSTEICAIEHLKGHNSAYLMANVLKRAREEGLRTHFHLLTANHLQSLRRLERIAATFPDFDLAYIRIETIVGSIPEGVQLVWEKVAEGGALVISKNMSSQKSLWSDVATVLYKDCQVVVRSRDGTAILIIKGPHGSGSRRLRDCDPVEFDPGRMRPEKLKRILSFYPSTRKRIARAIWRRIKDMVEKTLEIL